VARAAAWLALDRRSSAATELTVLADGLWGNLPARAALAEQADGLGLARAALPMADGVLQDMPPAQRLAAPPAFQRLAYPVPYGELVREAAADSGVPAPLLFAVIRQESRFEPGVSSGAGAVGLMQVMPDTGQHLADRLGLAEFTPADLVKPAVSLRLGANFLGQQLADYDGRVVPALAAYNAGPGNAARWWQEAGGDEDLAVELIDFPETAGYVRRVVAAAAAYERLYPDLR
jgi:soluble lytic murein transglycosylase